jgi:hypothetical protein
MSEDTDKDARMKELEAEVKALWEWRKRWEEQHAEDAFKAARSAPTGTPLQGVLGPSAQAIIDRATPPPDDLDLGDFNRIVGTDGRR